MKASTRLTLIASTVTLALAAAPPASAADPAQAKKPAPAAPAKTTPGECPWGAPGGGMGMGGGMMGGGTGGGMGGGMMGGGMMGGGMGGGMMGGMTNGGMGMGSGMMGGLGMLDLTVEQRAKINKIHDETRKKHWELTGKAMDEQARLRDLYAAPKRDNAAIGDSYRKLAEIEQQMNEAHLDAHKRVEAVLTKEQLEQMRNYWRGGGWPSR